MQEVNEQQGNSELLKTKYNREVSPTTFKEFKAELKLTKGDFQKTLLDEIHVMKTSGATDESVRRWLAAKHEFEVNRATFSRFKKKYNLTDNDKDPRARQKEALTKRAITQKQITDNNIHKDNIDLDIDSILQQQVTDIKTSLENLDKITKNAVGLEIDFEKLDREVRYNAKEKSPGRYLIDITELKIRYLELFIRPLKPKTDYSKTEPLTRKIRKLKSYKMT